MLSVYELRTCFHESKFLVQNHQGAGGSGNVLKEIVAPAGAVIEIREMLVGDATLSVLELWGAEFQAWHRGLRFRLFR